MSTITLNGDTSGYVNITVPSAAGANTVTFPAATGTVGLLTGSTTAGQVFYGGAVSGTFAQSSNLFWDNANVRLGIGTSSPTTGLHIYGNSVSLPDPTVTLANTTASTGRTYQIISGDGGPFRIYDATAAADRIRIDSSGNVGLGTTSPGYKLDVQSSAGLVSRFLYPSVADGGIVQIVVGKDSSTNYAQGALSYTYNATTPSLSYFSLGNNTTNSAQLNVLGNGNVGIGTGSPSGKLNVSDGTVIGEINPFVSSSCCFIGTRSNHAVVFEIAAAEKARIDTTGRFTLTSQPGFMAGIASGVDATITANSVVPFNTVTATNAFNTGSNFNTSTSLFTAPVAGKYFFSFTLFLTNSASNTQNMTPAFRVNGAFVAFTSGDAYGMYSATPNSTGGVISATTNVILNLSANDTVGVAARGNNLRVYQGHCFFSGYLLG